jgi:hypothetical protein
MHDESVRTTVLELAKKGWTIRRIAVALNVSRKAVEGIIKSGEAKPPVIIRPEKAESHRDRIVELYADCRGNLVRVHEKLTDEGAKLSYQALTGFCRRHEIGRAPKPPAGNYDFAPGAEMQHDTSPFSWKIGGVSRLVQIASLVLCFSRMIFIQLYSCFTRFECKVFLTDAFTYFDGVCKTCMVDNTSVIRLKGTGKDMVPVPEMACFSKRFNFDFAAHEVGDANRSARVEGHFSAKIVVMQSWLKPTQSEEVSVGIDCYLSEPDGIRCPHNGDSLDGQTDRVCFAASCGPQGGERWSKTTSNGKRLT